MKNKFREKICFEYLKNCNFDKKLENFYKKKTILITGGAGAIGSNLAISLSKLVGKRGRIIVLDNLSAIRDEEPWNLPSLENMIFVKGDIRNDEDLKRVFKERPEIIFHLAAFLQIKIQ
ncbi:MAG: hypothetical protein CM15mP123_09070 [Gammaproteobacteria bacterium]|nr:MAG: hypothetical protein CM15mP123_09070 [Gammaproteobacteria bacterium]